MTLDVYAGLFLDDLSNVAQRLHEAVTARSVSTVCPPPQIEEPPDEQ
jgi:hypothetical protein